MEEFKNNSDEPKTNRNYLLKVNYIFGVLWLLFWGIATISMSNAILRPLRRIFYDHNFSFLKSDYFGVVIFIICLLGVVSSIFIFKGERWARITIGLLALLLFVYTFLFSAAFPANVRWPIFIFYAFCLSSVILLLLPRKSGYE